MKPLLGVFTLAFLCFFSSQHIHSQSVDKGWTASFGVNAVNNPVKDNPLDIGRYKTWNMDAAGFRISAGRLITRKISFDIVASLNTVSENYENLDEDYPYISFDGMFKVPFTKGISFIDPYLTVGGGYTWLDKIGSGTANGGLGVNLWISPKFGINIQSIYKHAFADFGLKHYQHSAGIIFKLGGKDTDKDGIEDQDDACPEVFGVIEANGCPDTDGDGVGDKEDYCPNVAGLKDLRGCPDKDGDGTPDKFDKCPDNPGKIKDKGCPVVDTDRDGIPDRLDKCPKQPGNEGNNGCPKGKSDSEKQAKLLAAKKEKEKRDEINKKRELKRNVSIELNTLSRAILFNNGDDNLTPSDRSALNDIATVMTKYPTMRYYIAGHTDSIGSSASNLVLSEKRAQMVKNYLISKGIDENKLSAKGFGEENPIADNMTKDGRLRNRRVEIFIRD